MRLDLANFVDIPGGQILDALRRRLRAVEARRLNAVEGLVPCCSCKRTQVVGRADDTAQAEERPRGRQPEDERGSGAARTAAAVVVLAFVWVARPIRFGQMASDGVDSRQ